MDAQTQITSIIRQRGQLTIPDDVRERLKWTTVGSVVTIAVTKPNEIVIQPYSTQYATNWDKIWAGVRRARSYKGGGRGNLSAFIVEDRQTRR